MTLRTRWFRLSMSNRTLRQACRASPLEVLIAGGLPRSETGTIARGRPMSLGPVTLAARTASRAAGAVAAPAAVDARAQRSQCLEASSFARRRLGGTTALR